MLTLLIVAAVVAVLFLPAKKPVDLFALPSTSQPAEVRPDNRAAIDSLLHVRDRLAANGTLSDASVKAVDTLWLDLLHGSQPK